MSVLPHTHLDHLNDRIQKPPVLLPEHQVVVDPVEQHVENSFVVEFAAFFYFIPPALPAGVDISLRSANCKRIEEAGTAFRRIGAAHTVVVALVVDVEPLVLVTVTKATVVFELVEGLSEWRRRRVTW